jgi:uncharacterized BrkB/YihY/UPF0761 family membrane protein
MLENWKKKVSLYVREWGKQEIAHKSSAISFYLFLSFFPALMVLVSLIGLFAQWFGAEGNPSTMLFLKMLQHTIPQHLANFVQESWERFKELGHSHILSFSFIAVLWSSLKGIERLIFDMGKILDGKPRPFGMRLLVSVSVIGMGLIPMMMAFLFQVIAPLFVSLGPLLSKIFGTSDIFAPATEFIWREVSSLGHYLTFLTPVFWATTATLLIRFSLPKSQRGHFRFRHAFFAGLIVWSFLVPVMAHYFKMTRESGLLLYGPFIQLALLLIWMHISVMAMLALALWVRIQVPWDDGR